MILALTPPKSPTWQKAPYHHSQANSQTSDSERPRKLRRANDGTSRFEPSYDSTNFSRQRPAPFLVQAAQVAAPVTTGSMVSISSATTLSAPPRNTAVPPAVPFEVFTIILQYVHEPATLSKLSKVCRVLHFLTAPRLLKRMWIDTSSSWQFLSAISTLQNPGHANNVHCLTLKGARLTTESEERLLMLALGALVSGMTRLAEFRWEREVPMPRSLYEALSRNPALKKLTVLHAPKDVSAPTLSADPTSLTLGAGTAPFILPAFRTISTLTVTGIDALNTCDWSRIALGSLKSLRLSFTTPHAEQDQPGGGLANFFRALITGMRAIEKARSSGAPVTTVNGTPVATGNIARAKLQLEEIEFENLFMPDEDETLTLLFDASALTKIVLIDCSFNVCNYIGSAPSTPGSSSSYEYAPLTPASSSGTVAADVAAARLKYPKLKTFKTNMLNVQTLQRLHLLPPLENLYFVDPPDVNERLERPRTAEDKELASSFMDAIKTHHGSSLKRLRLSALWVLSHQDMVSMTRSCPNLKECAWATEPKQWQFLHVILPFLQLRVLQVLGSPFINNLLDEAGECPMYYNPTGLVTRDPFARRQLMFERALAQEWFADLRYLALAEMYVLRLQRKLEIDENIDVAEGCVPGSGYRRVARVLTREEWPEGLMKEGSGGISTD